MATIDLGKKSGALSLAKDTAVTIDASDVITASVSFSAKTDYDVYAVVLMKDGTQRYCATFGDESDRTPHPQVPGVRHLGDVRRGGGSGGGLFSKKPATNTETLEVQLTADVVEVAIAAYSAQSNGSGSFRKYSVSLLVDNGQGTTVTVAADEANSDNAVYTCVPAIIRNTPDGAQIERVEMYSSRGSERRPAYKGGRLVMDAGPKNLYK